MSLEASFAAVPASSLLASVKVDTAFWHWSSASSAADFVLAPLFCFFAYDLLKKKGEEHEETDHLKHLRHNGDVKLR